MLNQFTLILPEIILLSIVMCMQLIAVFYKDCSRCIACWTVVALFALFTGLLYFVPEANIGFNNSFEISPIIYQYKALVLGLAVMSVVIYKNLTKISDIPLKIEFITLVLLSTLGVFISISARDFLLLFCGLELSALSGYALAAFNNKDVKSSEAGLKYFILGALVSCLMLLGVSFLYGFSGSIYFSDINLALNDGTNNIGLVIGAIFVLAALLFKLSAAPLHIWTPDVYEGSPISTVSFFAVAQKMGTLVILINFIILVVGDYVKISVDLIKIVAILSIFIGALGAIMQTSLKRLMAYSTILNIGYVLIGVMLHTELGIYAALLYMFIYVVGAAGFFACLVALFGAKSDSASFADLQGIAKGRKTIAAAISILMFSMIGLPPLAGFFGKYYVFYNAIMQGEFLLALLGVLSSVIAAFYYLKVVKYMYFMESQEEMIIIPTNRGLLMVSVISVGFTLFFFIFASSYLG
jgi:NADH-quinone oxidoreductase subunit N